jgi:activator of HSP90 ATPase
MKTVKKHYEIYAPIEKVWQALVDPKIISKWSDSPANMSDKEGDFFALWDKTVIGKNLEVIPTEKLVQNWKPVHWKTFSRVTFTIFPKKDWTVINMEQTGVPSDEYAEISDGWNRYYLGKIKKLLDEK